MAEDKRLYERIGGIYPISLVVNRFSDEVVDNPKVGKGSPNPQLNDWSTNHLDRLPGLKYMRTLWVAAISGGPFEYTGLKLGDAHAKFRIKPEEFDEVAAELRRALEYYKVPEREKEEAMAAFISFRDEVTAGSKTP
ncbi:MAG: group I truncated hemoglobin [Halobacteriota archaeon]